MIEKEKMDKVHIEKVKDNQEDDMDKLEKAFKAFYISLQQHEKRIQKKKEEYEKKKEDFDNKKEAVVNKKEDMKMYGSYGSTLFSH